MVNFKTLAVVIVNFKTLAVVIVNFKTLAVVIVNFKTLAVVIFRRSWVSLVDKNYCLKIIFIPMYSTSKYI